MKYIDIFPAFPVFFPLNNTVHRTLCVVNMIKAFIFDFDGTIAETIPLVLAACDVAYDKLGLKRPTHEEIAARFGPTELGMFKRLDSENYEALFAQYLIAYEDLHDKYSAVPFDGIAEVLKKISDAEIPIALITGKSTETAEISIKKYGLEGVFAWIGCGGMSGSIKTQRIKEFLREFDIKAEDAYYIGDNPQDVVDTYAAGAHPLSAAWTELADKAAIARQNPEIIFDSTAEFSCWLDERLS